jgi:hypothetical protein
MIDELLNLLGKKKDDSVIQAFIKANNGRIFSVDELEDPESYNFYKNRTIVFCEQGIEFSFDQERENILSEIFLHSLISDKRFKEFRGDLPLNISFEDTRREVKEKLGVPRVSSKDDLYNKWDGYVIKDDFAVHIKYDFISEKVSLITLLAINLLSDDLKKIWL